MLLQWRHNEHDGASNHRRFDSILNRLFRRRTKKTSKGGGGGGVHRWPVNSPHKGPVTWELFTFDDVIMPRQSGIGLFLRQTWQTVYWKVPGPFTVIFHICVTTRFNGSVRYDISITIRFTLIACYNTARLSHSLTTWIVLGGQL